MTLPARPLLRPARLAAGARVAVVAPSGPVPEERLVAGLDVLRGWDLDPVVAPHVLGRHGEFDYLGVRGVAVRGISWCSTPPATRGSRFSEVTWRQGRKGAMTARFTVLASRSAGKRSPAAAQEAGGGRDRWDGVLPVRTHLAEWPEGRTAIRPGPSDGLLVSNLPATTPVADLVRWATGVVADRA